MKDTENYHLKVHELCDCYATTDLLKKMSKKMMRIPVLTAH
jgi:hypothetical protein